ncbi:MAG TPA: tripartite tricarboxylate transporter substrate binding protein [Burkholderiaceae bacterium]|jgi:tripartite-type tricarboxylate transporter receptor subunit TctC|nr:tripartite tricarboxylate transporter substrate binding protein [Burkholderiaceae bacterium]
MIRRIATALCALVLSAAAHAQPYPNKPVKLIVPYPAGQATDIAARLIAEGLSREWGQQVVVENIGGGAAIPGMLAGRGAQPDGYTLLMGTSAAMVVNPAILQKLPYDPFNDFTLIGPVFRNPLAIFANDKAPYNSLKELVDAAKKEPGKLNWGYPGAGTTQHLTGELFKQVAGVNIQGVMYKGSSQVVNDLLGNQIQLSVDGIPANLPHVKAGKLRVLASTGSSRAPQLPDVPTVAELGYPGFSGEGWGGVVVTRSTPMEIVNKVSADLRKVLSDPAMQQRLVAAGLVVDNQPRDEWISFARQTLVTWGEVARRNNIKID